MKDLETLIKSGKATIVDVRTPAEFMSGHVAGSINIPLQQLPARMSELKNKENIVLCCASGGRSAQATQFLKGYGIDCIDAGSWMNVNCYC